MKSLITIILTGVLLATLAGCGQKGPLYVPDDPERSAKERLEGFYRTY